MRERFLPIGTVLLLKGGKKQVMVTSYCIFPTNSSGTERKMYEYGGCVYPEGILDSNMACAFNHDQIEKIYYTGYTSEAQTKLSQLLNSKYDAYKLQFETTGNLGKVDKEATATA